MTCDCEHSEVCRYKDDIIISFDRILYARFGGTNPALEDLKNLIERFCIYRPKKTTMTGVTFGPEKNSAYYKMCGCCGGTTDPVSGDIKHEPDCKR